MRNRVVVILMTAWVAGSCSNSNSTGPTTTVAKIAVSPDTVHVVVPDSLLLTASPLDGQGHLVSGVSLTFSSQDPSIATVSAVGEVKGIKNGFVRLTVSGGGATTTVPVFVNGAAYLVATPDSFGMLVIDTVPVTVTAYDASNAVVAGLTYTFTSLDPSVALVSSAGKVHGVALGQATVTVSGGGASTNVTVVVTDRVSSPVASSPFGAAVSAKGVVYITQLYNASVARATLPSRSFTGSVSVGSVPTSVTFDSAGSTAFVTNQSDLDVGVINVASGTQTTTFYPPGGGNTAIVRSAPHGNLLWVTTTADSLFGYDETTHNIVHRFGTGGWGNGIAFTPTNDSLVYVGDQSGNVEEINYKADTVLRNFVIGGHPQGIAVSPDGTELYVADEATDSLHVWSLTSGTELTTVLLNGGAFDLQLSPDGTKLWVGEAIAGEVQIVNRAARTIAKTYNIGGTVRRIAFTPDGSMAVIANEGGWVDFIRYP